MMISCLFDYYHGRQLLPRLKPYPQKTAIAPLVDAPRF